MSYHFEPISRCTDQEDSLAQYLDEGGQGLKLDRADVQNWRELSRAQPGPNEPSGKSPVQDYPSLHLFLPLVLYSLETGTIRFGVVLLGPGRVQFWSPLCFQKNLVHHSGLGC